MATQLLHHTDGHVKELMEPSEAIKLVRRLRRVALFVRCNAELVTERDEGADTYRYFPVGNNLRVSQRQALAYLTEVAASAKRLTERERDPKQGRVDVTRLGNCLFIG